MSEAKIGRIIDAMRHERYRFSRSGGSTSRKRTGRLRPLGLPSWSDKLVGEVVRLLLEAYYEPTFSDRSHGFRPGRGCHTALREVARHLDGDDLVHRGRYLRLLRVARTTRYCSGFSAERIHDNRFLRLIRNMLKAGYLEDWEYHAHAQRRTARRRGLTDPLQYLPGQAGQVRRDSSHPAVHPGTTGRRQPRLRSGEEPL